MTPVDARLLRKCVIAVCVALCALGVLLMIEGSSSLAARTIALGAILAAAALARSRWAHPGLPRAVGSPDAPARTAPRRRWPNRWWWIASGALAAGTFASYLLMLVDQAHGGRALWPLYSFTAFVLAGAVVWSLLGTKLLRW